MRIGTKSRIAIVAAVVVAVAGWALFQRYWYYIPGILLSIRNPIEPNHPVTWESGPAVAAAPPEQRPPNVVLILADDLGFNDITVNGGGVADGSVPTPNIDAIAHEGVSFAQGYAGDATCAPSRAAIMTGPFRDAIWFRVHAGAGAIRAADFNV